MKLVDWMTLWFTALCFYVTGRIAQRRGDSWAVDVAWISALYITVIVLRWFFGRE